jgi:hypothetical protein
MIRSLFVVTLFALLPSDAEAQEILRGKITKLDVEGKKITVTVDGKDQEYGLEEQTRVLNATGDTLAERMKGFAVGSSIYLQPVTRDGREVLNAIKLDEGGGGPNRPATPGRRIMEDTSHMKPLTELGTEKYQGFAGGLYPDGKNVRPKDHEAAGLKLAADVRPLNTDGEPDDENGRVVLMSIGMSNTSQVSMGFRRALGDASGVSPRFMFIDGAQGGMTAEAIDDPDDGGRGAQYWRTVDDRLEQQGLSRKQVQAVWIKQADAGPRQGFPDYAKKLEGELLTIVHVIHERFPNVKLAYLSSRTYGGYATTGLNPEPYAFESGFSVKWLIEKQLAGDAELNYDPKQGAVKAPWLSWGPYLWTNGRTKRADDGFTVEPADFVADGTHHSPQGMTKHGELLLKFFSTDATTKPWFNAAK